MSPCGIGTRYDQRARPLLFRHRGVLARDLRVTSLVVRHLANVPVDARQGFPCLSLGGKLHCRLQVWRLLALNLIDDCGLHAVFLQLRKRPPRFDCLQLLHIS